MYPYITLMSLCRNVRLLAGKVTGAEPTFVQVLKEYEREALLGSVSPVTEEMIHAGLQELRAHWDTPDHFPPRQAKSPGILERERRLAFCLGGLVQVSSGLRLDVPAPDAMRCDRVILLEMVIGEERDQFEAFLRANAREGDDLGAAFTGLLRALLLRSLAEAHTLIPDMVDVHGWMDRLIQGVPEVERQVCDFSQVVYGPGSAADGQQAMADRDLISDTDPAIRAVRAIRNDQEPNIDAEALSPDRNRSAYGKAVCRSLAAVVRASHAWRSAALSEPRGMIPGEGDE